MVAIDQTYLTVEVEPTEERTLYFRIEGGELHPVTPVSPMHSSPAPIHLNPRHAEVYKSLENEWDLDVRYGGDEELTEYEQRLLD